MSTEHQQYSTKNQSDKIREYATRRGIEIVRTYTDVNRRAKLSKVLGKRALKSFHPRLFNDRLFAGESWSDRRGRSCRNSAVAFCGESDRQ
nr:recombinase family protein [Methylomonas denitrificans]